MGAAEGCFRAIKVFFWAALDNSYVPFLRVHCLFSCPFLNKKKIKKKSRCKPNRVAVVDGKIGP